MGKRQERSAAQSDLLDVLLTLLTISYWDKAAVY
jgi:hypothetical protein